MSDDLADRINAQLDDCTPGPWRKDKGFWNSDHETTDVHIMVGRKFDDADGEIAEVVTRWDGSTPAQRMQARANARLIAAAPSLLAEARDEIARLRELLGLCPDCGDNGDCGETAVECGHEFHGDGRH